MFISSLNLKLKSPDHLNDVPKGKLILVDIGIPPDAYSWKTLQLEYAPPFGGRFRIRLQTIV